MKLLLMIMNEKFLMDEVVVDDHEVVVDDHE